ncbi:hypothetical protein BFX40_10625 [Mesorhizobium sp. SEMIA 3007]|uniref:GMC family oxidoreductase n=1 Tax=Mesorhizobium sp. SEMIA 3007 TaxID=1862350 RepID=UPI00083D0FE7|nr:GMC family oxidoreductase N-terminal domain-containing protein [Mesorhizobium sp. SEMIA 3007]ODA97452.1 hypothetical protein BFX40_10625 [Mesorhizobium sp. SEMIA 3007]
MNDWAFETDFCVVGAGSAGCVVAARLSEDKGTKVLLVEAGSRDWHPHIHIPAGYFYLLKNPTFNWMYETQPEELTKSRKIGLFAGRGLGGSSSINGMLFARGQAAEYDRWSKDLGCRGWGFSDLLPFFRRAETFSGSESQHRGGTGPVSVEPFRTVHPLAGDFVEAAVEAGYDRVSDMNSPQREGASLFQQNRRGRFRDNTSSAYLRPAMRRNPSIRVETNAVCTRIIFNGRKVEGIEFTRAGQQTRVKVTREVIISSGAIRSPQLLQVSGIGDPDLLAAIGVPVVQSSPQVGRNLRDQYMVRMSHRVKGVQTINETNTFGRIAVETLKYVFRNRGLLTLGASMAALYCRSSPDARFPDLQLMFAPVSFSPTAPGKLEKAGGMTIGVFLVCPDSHGTIFAQTGDMHDKPLIHPRYLSDPRDWPRLLSGLRTARELYSMDALRRWSVEETVPGRQVQSDEELFDYARRVGASAAHYAGTCQMGPEDQSVTDLDLRVRGVSGLRVVDNSVIPSPVSGGMNATAIAIGEKAADLLKAA